MSRFIFSYSIHEMKQVTIVALCILVFISLVSDAKLVVPNAHFSRLLSMRGGQKEEGSSRTIMFRMQLPSGKVEKVELQPTDSLATVAAALQTQYKENPASFKASKLQECTIELQGKTYTINELLQHREDILQDKQYKIGEWIVVKPSPKVSTSSFSSPAAASSSSTKKRGKFQSFADIEKYKQSLFKFSKKRDKSEALPLIQLPSSLLTSHKTLFQQGGIQVLFGFSSTANDGNFHHILGSYNLLLGDLISENLGRLQSLLEDPSSVESLQTKIKALNLVLQSSNLKILGFSICTHKDHQNNTNLSSWNSIIFHVILSLSNLLQRRDLIVVSVSPKSNEVEKSSTRLKKNRLNLTEEFVLEGYRLHAQTYNLSEGLYLKPISSLKHSGDGLNKVYLEKTILLGADEVDELDASLLSQPLPIELVEIEAVVPFQHFFPSREELSQNNQNQKYLKRFHKFLHDIIGKLVKLKGNNNSKEMIATLHQLRDIELLLHLTSPMTGISKIRLPSLLVDQLIKEFVRYDQKELDFIHRVYTAKHQKLQKHNGKDSKLVKELENPLLLKQFSKKLQMELSMVWQTLPKEKIVYQGAGKSKTDDDDDL